MDLGVFIRPKEVLVVPYLAAVVHTGLNAHIAGWIRNGPEGCCEHLGVTDENGLVVQVSDVRSDHMLVAGKGILQRDAVPLVVPADHTHIVLMVTGNNDGLPEVFGTPIEEGVAFHLAVLKIDDIACKKKDISYGIKEAIGVYEL